MRTDGWKDALKKRVITPLHKGAVTPINLHRHRRKAERFLEVGPGFSRIAGFETLDVTWGRQTDYVADAAEALPFQSHSFDLVYASHVLEHIPWYFTAPTLKEWVRILKRGGVLEIWVPDGLKIAKAFVAAEESLDRSFEQDGWWRFNASKDPCTWMSGRTFSYGDGAGTPNDPNWHRALFSERSLRDYLHGAGLTDIRRLEPSQVRGHDHGWINLGLSGCRPA
jgi:SAM-dependent methyltransferase